MEPALCYVERALEKAFPGCKVIIEEREPGLFMAYALDSVWMEYGEGPHPAHVLFRGNDDNPVELANRIVSQLKRKRHEVEKTFGFYEKIEKLRDAEMVIKALLPCCRPTIYRMTTIGNAIVGAGCYLDGEDYTFTIHAPFSELGEKLKKAIKERYDKCKRPTPLERDSYELLKERFPDMVPEL